MLRFRGFASRFEGSPTGGAETSAEGQFAFPDMPEGTYDLSAERSGFERVRRAVRVQAGKRATLSLTLHVALVEEMIVTAGRAASTTSSRAHRDQCRFGSRFRPPRSPDHRRGTVAGALGDVFAEHRLGPAHDSVGSVQTRCLPDRIPVRRSISTASTSLGQPWRSRGFSIWSASRSFEGRRARCMDATLSAGR